MIPVVLLVTMIVFFMLFLSPGDPLALRVPLEEMRDLDEAGLQALRHQYGLDRPLPVQYVDWLLKALQGDLGRSLRTRQRVNELLVKRLPVSAELGLLSMALSLIVAIPVGIYSAWRPGSKGDTLGSSIALFGVAAPNFWVAIILILLFAVKLRLVPPSGFVRWTDDLGENLKLMLLPAITMGTAGMAMTMRMTRSCLLEVLNQDFVRTARAKGLGERSVLVRHALRNAMIPVVTILGLRLGGILGGTVIIEQIFSIPGMGKLTVDAIFGRDYPVVQASVLVITLTFVVANLAVDLVYAYLDPRIRYR
jgi:peptide/nickel transport system permease protein